MNPCQTEALCLNNNLHRIHLGYLELALCHIRNGQSVEAARILRVFATAEALRREERKRITREASPHQTQHDALKAMLARVISQKCAVLP